MKDDIEEKRCTKCGETKPLDDFYPKNKTFAVRSKRGHWYSECKVCFRKRMRPANLIYVYAKRGHPVAARLYLE